MPNKYKPELSEKRLEVFNAIQRNSEALAKKKNAFSVHREISLFVLMNGCQSIVTKLGKTGADAEGFFKELYYKYKRIDYKILQMLKSNDGEPDENEIVNYDTKSFQIVPDVHFLTVLAKNLSYNKIKSDDRLLYNTFVESVRDAQNASVNYNADTWSVLMHKYLWDNKNPGLYVDPLPDLDDQNSVKLKENRTEVTQQNNTNASEETASVPTALTPDNSKPS